MAKKAAKQEELPVEEVVVEAVPVIEPAVIETEEAVKVEEEVVSPRAGNEVGVVRIVQKTPSGFRVLLETGEIVKVSKAQYTKGQSTIIL